MEWSNGECIQLVQEYQLKPVLWNPKYEFYFSKIKNKMPGKKQVKFKKKHCRREKKALSLSGSFRREKSKGKRTVGTGTGT